MAWAIFTQCSFGILLCSGHHKVKTSSQLIFGLYVARHASCQYWKYFTNTPATAEKLQNETKKCNRIELFVNNTSQELYTSDDLLFFSDCMLSRKTA